MDTQITLDCHKVTRLFPYVEGTSLKNIKVFSKIISHGKKYEKDFYRFFEWRLEVYVKHKLRYPHEHSVL